MPHLKELYERYKDQGLVLIGVHTPSGWDKAPDFIDATGMHYPVCWDEGGETIAAYGINSYPDYCLIDRQGVLRFADLANAELDRAVEYLLAEPGPDDDLTEALTELIEAQPRLRMEALQGEEVLLTIDLSFSLLDFEGEACVRVDVARTGLAEGTESVVASLRDLGLRSVLGRSGETSYSYRVEEGRLVGKHGEDRVDLELSGVTLTQGVALLRAALVPFEEEAQASFEVLEPAGPALMGTAVARYAGEETVDLNGGEVRVQVIEMIEHGSVQVRMLLNADHLLLGVQPSGESAPRMRVSTPTGKR